MITNPQTSFLETDLATGDPRLPHERLRLWGAPRPLTIALAALVLSVGGGVAQAGEAASPGVAPTAVERISATESATKSEKEAATEKAAQGFSAQSLVARAEADLAAGHPGLAILSYQRARLLAPRAPAVTAGLTRAQSMAGLPPDDASRAMRAARYLDGNEWGWLGMIGLILASASLVAHPWGLMRRRTFLALALGGLGMAGLGFVTASSVTPQTNSAVAIAADTVARIAPFERAEQAFTVPEGASVTVERTHDHYALIACAEGHGWVPERALELILPSIGQRS